MHVLNELILNTGIFGIVIVIFIESAFPFGFFLPGDTLLFAAGILAAKGNFTIEYAIGMIFLANFIGVNVGYLMGRRLEKSWEGRKDGRFVKRKYIERATLFYEKHGGKAIALGRFIPAVRSFVPFVAGVARMSYRRLIIFNAIGALGWVLSLTLLGYFAGGWLERHGIDVELLVLPIFLLIVVLSFSAPLIHNMHEKGFFNGIIVWFKKLRNKK